jgi:endoglucanase
VEVFPAVPKDNRPLGRGVIGPRPKKDGDAWTLRWTEAPPKGSRPDFAVLALVPFEVKDGWLSSRSIDDLLGCAIGLEAVRRLAEAKVKTNVTVLLNRAEEVGFVGALEMAGSGLLPAGDSYLSIESSRELPGSRPGRGPTIRLGDKACAFDPNLLSLLDDAAARLRKRGTRVQRLRLTGGTCEATAYLAYGLEAAGVAVPLVNYHNGWGAKAVGPERVRVSDVEGAVRLVVKAAKLFPGRPLRGFLKERLAKRRALTAPELAKLPL